MNLQEGWWRLFRRNALVGQSFANADEIEQATRFTTTQLNWRANSWIWDRPRHPITTTIAVSFSIVFKERSSSRLGSFFRIHVISIIVFLLSITVTSYFYFLSNYKSSSEHFDRQFLVCLPDTVLLQNTYVSRSKYHWHQLLTFSSRAITAQQGKLPPLPSSPHE